ncbi:hypothetical protein [Sphingomonas oryzagri]|uniref:Phasin domain-containing protein n=1 Tax=Sphingomonas oryzagri TaxID=3042314 RepID=A0ABT6N2M6_9SPHN|nr:hypothetical protein [Sphingomonas oryzagri]MDH7639296.1 hypothetical protein [Sphingomonas oryzagri]
MQEIDAADCLQHPGWADAFQVHVDRAEEFVAQAADGAMKSAPDLKAAATQALAEYRSGVEHVRRALRTQRTSFRMKLRFWR